jgi:Glycosyl transferases group 1
MSAMPSPAFTSPVARAEPASSVLAGRHVNLLGWDNGVGLSRDIKLLAEVLADAGSEVTLTLFERNRAKSLGRANYMRVRRIVDWMQGKVPTPRFDMNIMIEHLRPHYFGLARQNLFIPNPEWFPQRKVASLRAVDTVLCKTAHARTIFDKLGCHTELVGFTNQERFMEQVPRERAFFHLAGRSKTKGTQRLLELWHRHPEWPTLTVVQHADRVSMQCTAANVRHLVGYLGENELRELQNAHLFHICPSETEGFGHYLCEALCVGAVTLTLNAAPMNEFVNTQSGILVDYADTGTQGLVTTYMFDERAMERAVERAIGMEAREIEAMGSNARAWYKANDHRFRNTLPRILGAACL